MLAARPRRALAPPDLLAWSRWPLADRWLCRIDRRKLRERSGPSGNAAFDEYREETLRKVADEQRGFREFLERLRRSKDKQEFDRFMADRRGAPSSGPQRSLPAV